MIHHSKALDLEMTDGENQFDRTYTSKTTPYQTLDLKHVDITKVLDKPTYDTSFERSWLGDHRLKFLSWSDIYK